MTWFKVDDSFHSHPKVLATDPAALGLWVVAGAWSSANLTGGFVPDRALPRLLPDGASLAQELAAAGLWKRSKGGYLFHDWTDYNPTPEDVKAGRDAAKQRMRKLRESRKAAGQDRNGSREQSRTSRERSIDVRNPVPSRPEGTGTDTASQSSSRRNARAWADDDDSIDLGIVELLAELTGRQVSILDAAKIRHAILDGRRVKSRGPYVARAIEDNPSKFLPAVEAVEPNLDSPPLRVVRKWCGQCDAHDRTIELADGKLARCQECNPHAKDPFAAREVS